MIILLDVPKWPEHEIEVKKIRMALQVEDAAGPGIYHVNGYLMEALGTPDAIREVLETLPPTLKAGPEPCPEPREGTEGEAHA